MKSLTFLVLFNGRECREYTLIEGGSLKKKRECREYTLIEGGSLKKKRECRE